MDWNWQYLIPGYGPLKAGYDAFYGDPANEVKGAYDKAMGMSKESGSRISDFLMGQQGKALDFYKRPQAMFDAAYGQGLKPPVMPGGGGAR